MRFWRALPGLVIVLAAIVVAAPLASWAPDDPNHMEVRLGLGDWGELQQGQQVRALTVTSATTVVRYSSVTTDTELFLIVALEAVTTETRSGGAQYQLRSGDRTYDPVWLDDPATVAGYTNTFTLCFLISPEDVPGTVLLASATRSIIALDNLLVIDLGLDQATAAALVQSAQGATFDVPKATTEVTR